MSDMSYNGQKFAPLVLGVFFGIFLDRGGLTEYGKVIGQFLFQDFALLKVLVTAIVVGNIGITVMENRGTIEKRIKPFRLLPIIIGGLLFGTGFGILGFCIANSIAAAGTGAIHGLSGIFGILLGAWFFSVIYPRLPERMKIAGGRKITIEDVTKLPSWCVTVILILFYLLAVFLMESGGF